MIRYVLGSVALGATGYGVAKLLKNNCFNKKKPFFKDLNHEDYKSQKKNQRTKYPQ